VKNKRVGDIEILCARSEEDPVRIKKMKRMNKLVHGVNSLIIKILKTTENVAK
jgi:hypothetical protein